MFGGKKDLEKELELKGQEISLLKKRVNELSDKLAVYQNKESALVGALTEAQSSARRTVADAEARRTEILSDAEASKQRIQAEIRALITDANAKADSIINDAKKRSNDIITDAKDDAMQLANRAQAFSENYRSDVEIMKAAFRKAAESAAAQAEQYRGFIERIELSDAVERAGEYKNLTAAVSDGGAKLPDEYENPASLMRSIYSIQQRVLPVDEKNENDAEEIRHIDLGEAESAGNVAAPVREEAPAKPVEAVEAVVEAPASAEPPKQLEEERVWTVDEIVGEENELDGLDEELDGLDEELDAIIEDVLRGS